jgi:hypothetical protein
MDPSIFAIIKEGRTRQWKDINRPGIEDSINRKISWWIFEKNRRHQKRTLNDRNDQEAD